MYAHLQQRVEASRLLPLLQLLRPRLDLIGIGRRGGAQDVEEYAFGQRVGLPGHLYTELGIHGWRVVSNGRSWWGICCRRLAALSADHAVTSGVGLGPQ
jgi:hypothetical protein